MRTFTAALAAVAATAAFGFTAAPATSLMTDPAGDGNALNGQGLADDEVGTFDTGPATVGHGDVTSLGASTLYDTRVVNGQTINEVKGLRFTLGTAAQPSSSGVPVIHRIITQIGGCEAWVQHYAGSNGTNAFGSVNVRVFEGCGVTFSNPTATSQTFSDAGAFVSSWDATAGVTNIDIVFEKLPTVLKDKFAQGSLIYPESVNVRLNTGAVTAPVIDDMQNAEYNEFTVGEDVPTS